MNIILQPYYHWGRGHYKKYADSLLTEGDLLITSSLRPVTKTMIEYYLLRVLCMSICMLKLIFFYTKSKKVDVLFINEAEPISLFFFSPFFLFRSHNISLTLHAVDKNGTNFFDSILVFLQRKVMFSFLKMASYCEGFRIFVHTETHKKLALKKFYLTSNKVFVIEYPCPEPVSLDRTGSGLLLFGAVRSDKSMADFIHNLISYGYKGIDVYIVGKISDEKVLRLVNTAPDFIHFIDKYVTEDELLNYAKVTKYFLVPYGSDYTGGAGPIKDAASFGRPVLSTAIPIFRELALIDDNYSLNFRDVPDLYCMINRIDDEQYDILSRNAVAYAKDNNWCNFRFKYLNVMDNMEKSPEVF